MLFFSVSFHYLGDRSEQRKATIISSVTIFIDVMTNTEKEEIDVLVAKMIFKANLPFNLVENEEFKSLV
jgi:hypothetical protein